MTPSGLQRMPLKSAVTWGELVRLGCAGLWLIAALPLAVVVQTLLGQLFGGGAEPEIGQLGPVFGLSFLAAGALWARSLSRLAGATVTRTTLVAGALGYAVTSLVSLFALTYVEEHSHQFIGPLLRIHHLFMIVFALAAGLISGGSGASLGLAIGGVRLAARMGVLGALVGSATFLVVALLMDLLVGYRVGAPGAEERVTMITVALLGVLATCVVGSIALGMALIQARDAGSS